MGPEEPFLGLLVVFSVVNGREQGIIKREFRIPLTVLCLVEELNSFVLPSGTMITICCFVGHHVLIGRGEEVNNVLPFLREFVFYGIFFIRK